MNKITKLLKDNPLFWAFTLPMMFYITAMLTTQQPPFGNNAMLISDSFHQYYPFFLEFREALLSGDSLQWNWSLGMGGDYLGLVAYYNGSPLNLLAVFLPESWILPYFCLLVPVKLSLASLSMAYFLKRLYGKSSTVLPLFGCLYAFCGWTTLYFWNVMWLDGFALLPLVTWGTILLLRDRKIIPFILAIAATLIVNYYIAVFVCVFVFLLFLCYEYCTWRSSQRLRQNLLRIAGSTILAFCLAAFMFLPAAASLLGNGAAGQGYSAYLIPTALVPAEAQAEAMELWSAFDAAMENGTPAITPLIDAMKATLPLVCEAVSQAISSTAMGTFTPNSLESPPATYSGLVVLILVFLSFLSLQKPKKEKAAYLALLCFYALGMFSNDFTYILHGFHYPAQLPFRFTFVLSFLAITAAYPVWLQRGELAPWRVAAAGSASTVFLCLSLQFRESALRNTNIILLALFISGLLLCSILRNKIKSDSTTAAKPGDSSRIRRYLVRAGSLLAGGTLLLECFLAPILTAQYHSTNAVDTSSIQQTQAAINALQSSINDQELFYRTEITAAYSFNDGATFGFNSPSIFSSSVNDKTTEFLISLGADCSVLNNRAYLGNGSPVANLFTGLKYLVCTNDAAANNPLYELVASEGGISMYRNKTYLPLGFLAGDRLLELTFKEDLRSSFDFQNQLFSAATGIEAPVYTQLAAGDWAQSAPECISVTEGESAGSYAVESNSLDGTLSLTHTVTDDGLLVLCTPD